jgi:cytochrome P450
MTKALYCDIKTVLGFGHDFQSLTNSTSELGVSFKNISELDTPTRKLLRSLIPYYLNIPLKENKAMVHNLKVMERSTTCMIDEKIARARSIKSEGDARQDLLSVLICANQNSDVAQDGKLSNQELQDQVRIFMVAGHETTATAITWMLYALSINQDAQRRLRNELLQTFGRPQHSSSRPLTYDEINALPFLNACVKELLRCYPPVATSSRVATKDDVILGYKIPKGTTVRFPLRAIHRLKSVWGEDADIFKPERWLNPELVKKENPELTSKTTFVTPEMNWAYLPFLIGPRTCPGAKLALFELKILLYYLLINLEYYPSPGFKFVTKTVLAYRPDPGMRLTVKMYQKDTNIAGNNSFVGLPNN